MKLGWTLLLTSLTLNAALLTAAVLGWQAAGRSEVKLAACTLEKGRLEADLAAVSEIKSIALAMGTRPVTISGRMWVVVAQEDRR